MRPALIGVTAAVLVVAGVGVTAVIRRDAGSEEVEPPGVRFDPEALSFEQTDTAITLRIHNRSKHWGLRNQRVYIVVRHPDRVPINSYGPDKDSGVQGRPELGTMRCCEIPELRPGSIYTFTLFPSRYKAGVITVNLEGPPGWIRM